MGAKNKEIEIKFPLKNPEEVVKFLEANGLLISKDVFQRDMYYTPKHRNFLELKYPFEWLRVRETDKGCSINYKHFHPEGVEKTDYCDEFESPIGNASAVKEILRALDFKEVVIVEKNRTVWQFKDVEIMIDNVRDFGVFIELETLGDFEDPKQGKEYLYTILKEINAEVGEEDLRGYPFIILEKQGRMF